MSDANPFDDLAADTGESEDTTGDDTQSNIDSQTTDLDRDTRVNPAMSEASTQTERTEQKPHKAEIEGPTLENSSPPFPYSDAGQEQMYVQNGLWDEFEDLKFDAELELRRTFNVRNVEQRELDTAIVRLVLDQLTPPEIAEMVIQMRGFDPSNLPD